MYTSALSIFFKKAKFTSVAEKKSQSDFSLTAPLPPTHEKTLAVYAGTNPRRDAARKKSIFPLKKKQKLFSSFLFNLHTLFPETPKELHN